MKRNLTKALRLHEKKTAKSYGNKEDRLKSLNETLARLKEESRLKLEKSKCNRSSRTAKGKDGNRNQWRHFLEYPDELCGKKIEMLWYHSRSNVHKWYFGEIIEKRPLKNGETDSKNIEFVVQWACKQARDSNEVEYHGDMDVLKLLEEEWDGDIKVVEQFDFELEDDDEDDVIY